MRIANIYEPHHYRHMVSGVQIVGEKDEALEVRSNFLVVRTMELDGTMKVFASGQCRDLVEIVDGAALPLARVRARFAGGRNPAGDPAVKDKV